MNMNINFPIAIPFDTDESFVSFHGGLSQIISKLRVESIPGDNGGAKLYIFFTRKDKKYRELVEQYGGTVNSVGGDAGAEMEDDAIALQINDDGTIVMESFGAGVN
jgi:hypothetical protein